MIQIDNRVGSKDLADYLPPTIVELTRLEYADAAMVGKGADNTPELVGVERKNIRDLINSMTSGRFAGHQLIGLLNSYSHVYLLVEGLWRCGPTGNLELRNGKWYPLKQGRRCYRYADVVAWLNTMAVKCGLHILQTGTPRETANMLLALHKWWTVKEYEEHRSHLQPRRAQAASLNKQPLVRRVANQLTGVGWERALELNKHFNTVADMCDATPEDFTWVEGIGTVLSQRIWNELHEGG